MNDQHLGSNFDNFLAEEGFLAEVEANAIQRVIAYQIEQKIN
jgi:antitoxin HicB